jgi:hypothetical protein
VVIVVYIILYPAARTNKDICFIYCIVVWLIQLVHSRVCVCACVCACVCLEPGDPDGVHQTQLVLVSSDVDELVHFVV